MLGHKLSLKIFNNKILTNIAKWLLNTDATHSDPAGYVWLDGSAWADAQKFKG